MISFARKFLGSNHNIRTLAMCQNIALPSTIQHISLKIPMMNRKWILNENWLLVVVQLGSLHMTPDARSYFTCLKNKAIVITTQNHGIFAVWKIILYRIVGTHAGCAPLICEQQTQMTWIYSRCMHNNVPCCGCSFCVCVVFLLLMLFCLYLSSNSEPLCQPPSKSLLCCRFAHFSLFGHDKFIYMR